MRLKQRIEDFRVRELLLEAPTQERQHFRVYRVTKKKLTSLEAAQRLAQEVGVAPGEISMAGLKDRQGVTIQHMAVHHGPPVSLKLSELRIETVGYCAEALTPAASAGNAFEVVVRGLDAEQLTELRANMPLIRDGGVINYFDDQRFGNLRHGQGWIALDLMRGEPERALRALLTSSSFGDDPRRRAFKRAMAANWGDWRECRDVAGRFGEHHSLFEHLKREPEDFVGAFQHIATRLRLIHLYAFQSHLWNRAVADLVRSKTPLEKRVIVKSMEGPLVFPETTTDFSEHATFRLPGARLEDVENEAQRGLLEDALATERLVAANYAIEGIPGFGLKGEDRPLIIRPQHMRVRPAEPDPMNRGLRMVRVRFELPRGAYATLVVRRLLGRRVEGGAFQQDKAIEMSSRRSEDGRWSESQRGPGGHGGDRGQRSFTPGGRGGHGGDRGQRSFSPGGREGYGGDRSGGGRGARDGDRSFSPRGDRNSGGRERDYTPGGRGGYGGDRGQGGRDGQRSFSPGGRGGYGDRGGSRPGGHGGRFDERRDRSDEPGSRDPIQTNARPGAWRPGHGLSGDEPKDRDRTQGGGGRDDRGPRREFGEDRDRGYRPGGGARGFGARDDRHGGRRDDRRDDRGGSRAPGGDRGRSSYGGRPDRGFAPRGGGGHGGSRGGPDRRPWEADRSNAGSQGAANDDANWGAREDARNAESGSPSGSHGDRGRGEYGGQGSRPFGRRPEGGREDRHSDRRPDRRPERGSDNRPDRGAPRGPGGQGGSRGYGGRDGGQRTWGGSGGSGGSGGGRDERRSYGGSHGGSGGGRPRQDRGSSSWGGSGSRPDRGSHGGGGGDRSRQDRGPSGGGASGGWGGDRSRGDRGSQQRGGGRPSSGGKEGGWGANRTRHEHKPRGQDTRPSSYDRKPKSGSEQERNKDA